MLSQLLVRLTLLIIARQNTIDHGALPRAYQNGLPEEISLHDGTEFKLGLSNFRTLEFFRKNIERLT